MTTVSSVQGLDGYPVRARFRGPVIGHALNIGWRRWEATCATCRCSFASDNRIVASEVLGHHWNAEHKPARRVRLLR